MTYSEPKITIDLKEYLALNNAHKLAVFNRRVLDKLEVRLDKTGATSINITVNNNEKILTVGTLQTVNETTTDGLIDSWTVQLIRNANKK